MDHSRSRISISVLFSLMLLGSFIQAQELLREQIVQHQNKSGHNPDDWDERRTDASFISHVEGDDYDKNTAEESSAAATTDRFVVYSPALSDGDRSSASNDNDDYEGVSHERVPSHRGNNSHATEQTGLVAQPLPLDQAISTGELEAFLASLNVFFNTFKAEIKNIVERIYAQFPQSVEVKATLIPHGSARTPRSTITAPPLALRKLKAQLDQMDDIWQLYGYITHACKPHSKDTRNAHELAQLKRIFPTNRATMQQVRNELGHPINLLYTAFLNSPENRAQLANELHRLCGTKLVSIDKYVNAAYRQSRFWSALHRGHVYGLSALAVLYGIFLIGWLVDKHLNFLDSSAQLMALPLYGVVSLYVLLFLVKKFSTGSFLGRFSDQVIRIEEEMRDFHDGMRALHQELGKPAS